MSAHLHNDSKSDARLMRQIQAGDREAFRALVKTYQARLLFYCLSQLGNRGDAEDCAQDIFLEVFEKANLYQEKNAFPAWLFTMAKYRCIDRQRSRNRSGPKQTYQLHEEVVASLQDLSQSPLDILLQQELHALLSTHIDGLEEAEQALMLEYAMQRKSLRAMAKERDMPESTLRMHLTKIARAIRLNISK